MFNFIRTAQLPSKVVVTIFTILQAVLKFQPFLKFTPTLIVHLLDFSFSSRCEVESYVVLICTLAIYISSFVKHMFKFLAHFYELIFFSGHTPWHMESLFPNQGLNPGLLYWKDEALTTGLPGSPLS